MAIDKIMTAVEAETLALRGLQFLASEPEHIGGFLTASGTQPEDLLRHASELAFLLGALDHLLGDETLLFMFAESAQVSPEAAAIARRTLAGPDDTGSGM
jgi:hypothetical protein